MATWGFHEFYLERTAYYSYGIFEGEEDDSESIYVLDDYSNDGKLLKFFNCGDDKGDRGDDDHEEGEEGNKLCNFVGPWVLHCIPHKISNLENNKNY